MTIGYSFRLRLNEFLIRLNEHTEDTDSKYFMAIILIFAAMSGVALNYQQYITSAVLYMVAIVFDFLNASMGRVTGRISSEIAIIET